jgi:hypothetical protein
MDRVVRGNTFTHAPCVGGAVWDSGTCLPFGYPCGLLPTKTSRSFNQFSGGTPCCQSKGSQVVFTRCWYLLSLLILVAVILSLISLVFMAHSHLVWISPSECCFSLITLSHLRIHIRWADSVMVICISHVGPLMLRDRRSCSTCCLFW